MLAMFGAFIVSRTRFKFHFAKVGVLTQGIRFAMTLMAFKGMLPYGEVRLEDFDSYKPYLLNSYLLTVLFVPYNHLWVAFVLTPVFCVGSVLHVLAMLELKGELDPNKRRSEVITAFGNTISYGIILIIVSYRAQKVVTDLFIKNKVTNQQQDDVQRVLQNSSDGFVVYG